MTLLCHSKVFREQKWYWGSIFVIIEVLIWGTYLMVGNRFCSKMCSGGPYFEGPKFWVTGLQMWLRMCAECGIDVFKDSLTSLISFYVCFVHVRSCNFMPFLAVAIYIRTYFLSQEYVTAGRTGTHMVRAYTVHAYTQSKTWAGGLKQDAPCKYVSLTRLKR